MSEPRKNCIMCNGTGITNGDSIDIEHNGNSPVFKSPQKCICTERNKEHEIQKRLAIEQFMKDTYYKAKEMGCIIKVNPKTKQMSWELI